MGLPTLDFVPHLHGKGDSGLLPGNLEKVASVGYRSLTKALMAEQQQQKYQGQVFQFAYFPTAKTVSPTVIFCLA